MSEIFNTHNQVVAYGAENPGRSVIAITYQGRGEGLTIQVAGWHVHRFKGGKWLKTDKAAAWYDPY